VCCWTTDCALQSCTSLTAGTTGNMQVQRGGQHT
jgi:hypothetical protein